MYCHHCGHQISDGNLFCPQCGTRQNSPQQNQTANVQFNQHQQTGYREINHGTPERLGTLTAWCILSIFLCWPAAIYGWVKRSKAKKAATLEEANAIVAATIKGLEIWCGVMVVLTIIVALI